MIEALYIISQGGVPIYTYSKRGSGTDIETDILFSGLITAIKKFLLEIDVGEVRQFSTVSHNVQIFSENKYAVVFIYDTNSNINAKSVKKLYEIIIEELGDSIHLFEDTGGNLNKELTGLLSIAISNSMNTWEKYLKQSEAAKKIQESLW